MQKPVLGSKHKWPRITGYKTVDCSRFGPWRKLAAVCKSRIVSERILFHKNLVEQYKNSDEFKKFANYVCRKGSVILIDEYVPSIWLTEENLQTQVNFWYSHVFALIEALETQKNTIE